MEVAEAGGPCDGVKSLATQLFCIVLLNNDPHFAVQSVNQLEGMPNAIKYELELPSAEEVEQAMQRSGAGIEEFRALGPEMEKNWNTIVEVGRGILIFFRAIES